MRNTALRYLSCFGLILLLGAAAVQASAASDGSTSKVLTLGRSEGPQELALDKGAAGLWQSLLKLETTASALHITAHPDDEQGGVLTYLSRGQGVRTAMLTLTRGEGGANAIGSELFDSLGLVRTEELLISGRYYGLDDQYFGSLIDYGYSKTLSEAVDNWGRNNILRDMIRVIRINRPLVVISRFHGSERDGHGHHQASGVFSQKAFRGAGDPAVFPEQITQEGLRPWKPLKLYRSSGFRPDPKMTLTLDPGQYSPWLGTSYQQLALDGLSYQRSQNSGVRRTLSGSFPQSFERLESYVEAPEKETSFFEGVDTSLAGITQITGNQISAEVISHLHEIDDAIAQAKESYKIATPLACLPHLVQGLRLTREALSALREHREESFLLRIKERQFQEAIRLALGVELTASAEPLEAGETRSPWALPSTLGFVVPGQQFQVRAELAMGSDYSVGSPHLWVEGRGTWPVQASPDQADRANQESTSTRVFRQKFLVTVPNQSSYDEPYYYRKSIRDSNYQLRDSDSVNLPSGTPALRVLVRLTIDGTEIVFDQVVRSLEAELPYGLVSHQLKVVPELAVNVQPAMRIVPVGQKEQVIPIEVELQSNSQKTISGNLQIELPSGWKAVPPEHSFQFDASGQQRLLVFQVHIPSIRETDYDIRITARTDSGEHRRGQQIIQHRDLETNYLLTPSVMKVRGIDVQVTAGLRVGYVMGVGDGVPSAFSQLGSTVQLLGEDDLASSDLGRFDVIVVGTRAYAVRKDLVTYNQRLLDFAQAGGNLIVLYNTPEFVPNKWAPFPAELPRRAEEVSEEDSPIRILAPDHPLMNQPNKITLTDFDGWVEQRGSKFFSSWDNAYTPMIETHDRDQDPQQGGWLTAEYGRGHYTYFAYAFHRQAPYGVVGAYRIFANLLSLGK